MKNEALRIFLAVAALILTAMLTNPLASVNSTGNGLEASRTVANISQTEGQKVAQNTEITQAQPQQPAPKKIKSGKAKKKVAIKTVHRANRSFAFFFRR